LQVKKHTMLPTSSGSGRPLILAYMMVNLNMFHASVIGCRAWANLNSERREKGKHSPRAQEANYPGFEPNTSAWSFFIQEKQALLSTNKAQFDEHVFPFHKRSIINEFQRDNSVDILFQAPSDIKWAPYNHLHSNNYTRVHYDLVSDVMVMRVNTSPNIRSSHTEAVQQGHVGPSEGSSRLALCSPSSSNL
jgi:hypothetical protein